MLESISLLVHSGLHTFHRGYASTLRFPNSKQFSGLPLSTTEPLIKCSYSEVTIKNISLCA